MTDPRHPHRNLVQTGVSHREAGQTERERLALAGDARDRLLARLDAVGARERLVLSTCNRTEVYALAPGGVPVEAVHDAWAEVLGVPRDLLDGPLVRRRGRRAAEHLLRTAAGLESMVPGDTGILGQVRDAYAAAREAGATGATLNRLCETALRVGKRARATTRIAGRPVSVAGVAVEACREALGGLEGRTVLVVGAGDTGRLAARLLAKAGPTRMTVANRTESRAREVARALAADAGDGRRAPATDAAGLGDLPGLLAEADVAMFCCRTAPGTVLLDADVARRAAAARTGSGPLVVADLGVPRNVDPAVDRVPGALLHDMDRIQGVMEHNVRLRRAETPAVESLVAEGLADAVAWHRRRAEHVPALAG